MKAELKRAASLHIQEEMALGCYKNSINGLGILIGGYAAKVYLPSVKKLVKNDSLGYRYLLESSTVGINVVVNCYYNSATAEALFALRDPNSKKFKLLIPYSHLVLLLGSSFASALCFAFLDAENPFDFAALVTVYTGQHWIPLIEAYHFCRNIFTKTSVIQSELSAKLDNALLTLNKDPDQIPLEKLFTENNAVDIEKLADWIVDLPNLEVKELACVQSRSYRATYWIIQGLGFLATLISNIGYHNNTIISLNFTDPIFNQIVASVCMVPVYWLGLVATYKSIAKFSNYSGVEFSLPVKKAPVFAAVCYGTLTPMAIFSFCSAVSLLIDAIYGDDDPQFSWMDTSEQTMRPVYYYATAIVIDIFNFFPVGDVVDGLSKLYCKWFGSSEVKRQMKLLDFLQGMSAKAAKLAPTDIEQPLLDPSVAEEKSMGITATICSKLPSLSKIKACFCFSWGSSAKGNLQSASTLAPIA